MTIRLSPELEARIRERFAPGASESLESFVERVLRQALGALPEQTGNGKTPEQLAREADAFFAKLDASLPADTPILPDEALTRDALHQGRG